MTTTKLTVREVFGYLDAIAPFSLAEEWDNVGLQVGSLEQVVEGLVVCLDPSGEAIRRAVEVPHSLIVSHHPLIFGPLGSVVTDTFPGSHLATLCQHKVSLIAAHTNLDKAAGGVNDCLAERLGLNETVALLPAGRSYKFVVYVPEADAERVRTAIGDAGSGVIGNYSHCSFESKGIGRFTPQAGALPAIGKVGIGEAVNETRIETIVTEHALGAVISAALNAHPYEEAAYDVYPLRRLDTHVGLGRLGLLPEPVTLVRFRESVASSLGVPCRLAGESGGLVSRVAVCGGSGASLIDEAVKQGADVLVTGDIKYHAAQSALELGLAIIDAGHAGTENPVVDYLYGKLRHAFEARGVRMVSMYGEEAWCSE